MVNTRASSEPCVYCLETAIDFPVKLCSGCSARACARCFEHALKTRMLTPETMASDILCPMCRRPSLPSFAQLIKEPELQRSARWNHDSTNYKTFWQKVGRPSPPQIGVSRFVMCMYAMAADLRLQLLHSAEISVQRISTLARLRPRTSRDIEIEEVTIAAQHITSRFDECEPWQQPPQ